MTRTQTSIITLAVAALFAGPAMAANTGTLSREQVKTELAEAVRTGNVVTGESSARLNEQFPQNYLDQQVASTVSRAQVQAELAEAVQTGKVVVGESSARLAEVNPGNYPAQQDVASKSREQVRAELADAASNGQLYQQIEA